MNRKQLRNTLHLLNDVRGNINPRAEFVHKTREHLLSTLAHTVTAPKVRWFSFTQIWELLAIVMPSRAVYAVVRPVVMVGVAFGLVTGTWITGAFASLNSNPGDVLYPVKIGIENTTVAVVSVTQGTSAKATLQAEYAGRRLEEAKRVLRNGGTGKAALANRAIQRFKADVAEVNKSLDELKHTNLVEAVAVAKAVDKHAEGYNKTLTETKEVLANDGEKDEAATQVLADAQTAATTAETKSVEVYVETLAQNSDAISQEEVKQTVDKKIQQIQDRVEGATKDVEGAVRKIEEVRLPKTMIVEKTKVIAPAMQVQKQSEEVREGLVKTRELLQGNSFTEAADKVKELSTLSIEVQDKARAVQGTARSVDEIIRNSMEAQSTTRVAPNVQTPTSSAPAPQVSSTTQSTQ